MGEKMMEVFTVGEGEEKKGRDGEERTNKKGKKKRERSIPFAISSS